MIVCYVLRKKKYSDVKDIVFFSLLKLILYAILEKIDWVNQKSVLFFRWRKENTDLKSNEWMTCELLQETKKQKNRRNSKKRQPSYIYRIKEMACELLLGNKKTQFGFFLLRFVEKKEQHFAI